MLIKVNIKKEWVATVVVALFFLFFWINGPLLSLSNLNLIKVEFGEIVHSTLIDDEEKTVTSYKEVNDVQTKGHGYALILDSKKGKDNSQVIAFENSIVDDSEYGSALLENAKLYYGDYTAEFKLKQSSEHLYAEILHETDRYFYLQSKGICDFVIGYSGPINVGVIINENGELLEANIVSSSETRSYLEKISTTNYYNQYKNQSINKTYNVDAVSGATITTKAFALTTTQLIQSMSNDPISDLTDKIGISNYETMASLTWHWILEILIVFILFLYAYQKKLRKSKRFVLIAAIACLLYIGFFLNESFTYVTFLHPFIGTSLSSFMGLYALFVLLGAIWGKNTYCKYICPYGNIQRLQLKLTKGLNKKMFLSNKRIKQVRFTILFFLIVGILAGFRNLSNLEPFPYIFGFEIQSVWYFSFAVLGLLMNWVYPMIWCRLLCPTGSVLDTINILSTKK
jgi:NosR/NirI family nitrous oxide reductase transcriptional regulator